MPFTLAQNTFIGRRAAALLRPRGRSLGDLLRPRWHMMPWLPALGLALWIGPDIVELAVLAGAATLLSAVLRDAGARL